jgi:sterol desaturase/sphingolipid hydroxylase (fatty acid hydroxylase superfamily)
MMIGLYHYIALSFFGGFALLEVVLHGRDFPPVTRWRMKGAAFTLLYFALATYAPLFWDGWLGQHRLFAADTLPLWVQIVGGFLAIELGVYAWHRTMHNTPFLWRWFHQMHHSAERVDIWGALYFHPFDTLGFTFVGSLALVLGFGVSADAAIVVNLLATFYGLFQHANIKTPHWLGYIIQRPESHSAHHERGVHARNYSDLPLWDMIFGTFHNPKEFNGEVGFYEGGSKKLVPLLLGRLIA